jgi:hypothetical protein
MALPPDAERQASDVGPGEPPPSRWAYIGVGCLTIPIGFFGGGMIAVLAAKIVGAVQRCTPPQGFPACNTWDFLWTGALIGVLGVPTMAILRLRRGRTTPADSKGTR